MRDHCFTTARNIISLMVFTLSLLLMAGQVETAHAKRRQPSLESGSDYTGRIRLIRFLDEPDGYCIDVPGPPDNPFLDVKPWAHTCHMFALSDQVFHFDARGVSDIRWTDGRKNLCLKPDTAEAGSLMSFVQCDQSASQKFAYVDRQFKLEGTDLCIHVEMTGPAYRQQAAEGEDSYGRGRPINPQKSHLARFLVMQGCSTGDPGFSRWQSFN